MSRRLVYVPVATILAAMAVFAGTARVEATAPTWPTCTAHANRLVLTTTGVLRSPAVSVRTDDRWWTSRPDGRWVLRPPALTGGDVHVVVKSSGPGVRRWSGWVRCESGAAS